MFKNIGEKIKGEARGICGLGILASVIGGIAYGIAFFEEQNGAVIIAFLIVLLGIIVSWLACLCLYGFGELVHNSSIIAACVKKQENNSNQNPENDLISNFTQNTPPVSNTIKCKNCGHVLDMGTKFCDACGSKQ